MLPQFSPVPHRSICQNTLETCVIGVTLFEPGTAMELFYRGRTAMGSHCINS